MSPAWPRLELKAEDRSDALTCVVAKAVFADHWIPAASVGMRKRRDISKRGAGEPPRPQTTTSALRYVGRHKGKTTRDALLPLRSESYAVAMATCMSFHNADPFFPA